MLQFQQHCVPSCPCVVADGFRGPQSHVLATACVIKREKHGQEFTGLGGKGARRMGSFKTLSYTPPLAWLP